MVNSDARARAQTSVPSASASPVTGVFGLLCAILSGDQRAAVIGPTDTQGVGLLEVDGAPGLYGLVGGEGELERLDTLGEGRP